MKKSVPKLTITVALVSALSLMTASSSAAGDRPAGLPATTTVDVPQVSAPAGDELGVRCARVVRAELIGDTVARFGDDVAVTRPRQSSSTPAMAIRANGDIFVVTDDLSANALDIFRSTNGGSTWIYHASLVGDAHLLTPSVAVGEGVANRLLVAYHYGKGTPSSSIIVYWEDLDTGAYGSSVVMTAPAPYDPQDPAICVDSPEYADWYAYLTYSWDAPIPAPDGVYITQFVRSVDLGASWVDLRTLQYSPGDVRSSDIDFAGETLVAVYAHERPSGSDPDVSARISLDYGDTWADPIPLAGTTAAEAGPRVAVGNAGSHVVVAYTAEITAEDIDIQQYSSTDGGASWTWSTWPHVELPEFNCDVVEDPRTGGFHGSFWRQNSGANGFTMHLRSDEVDPTTWLDLSNVCDTGQAVPWGRPVIAVDPTSERLNEACIAWGDFREDPMRHVYFDGPGVDVEECTIAPFEDLTLGASYVSGDVFSSSGIDIRVDDFYYVIGPCGGPMTSGDVRVIDDVGSCRPGKELWLDNVTLIFDFHEPLYQVTIPFGEYGGVVDLGVNGDCRVVADFRDLDQQIVGGCLVTVVDLSTAFCGEIAIEGPVEQLVVGGQELAIDDVQYCRRVCENLTITMDFESLPLGLELPYGSQFQHGYSELTPPGVGFAVETTMDTYFWSAGCTNPYTGGVAIVQEGGGACAGGHELRVDNVNLRFDFDGPVERLSIQYGEYGGSVNLQLNGVCLTLGDFREAIGPYPDAYVFAELYPGMGGCGRVVVNGKIDDFAIGGQELVIDSIEACLHPVVDVPETGPVSSVPRVWNAPNPFRRATTIHFALRSIEGVSVDVFDVVGRRVRTLLHGDAVPAEGRGEVTWDARDEVGRRVPPGVYFYRVRSGSTVLTRHIVLVE